MELNPLQKKEGTLNVTTIAAITCYHCIITNSCNVIIASNLLLVSLIRLLHSLSILWFLEGSAFLLQTSNSLSHSFSMSYIK